MLSAPSSRFLLLMCTAVLSSILQESDDPPSLSLVLQARPLTVDLCVWKGDSIGGSSLPLSSHVCRIGGDDELRDVVELPLVGVHSSSPSVVPVGWTVKDTEACQQISGDVTGTPCFGSLSMTLSKWSAVYLYILAPENQQFHIDQNFASLTIRLAFTIQGSTECSGGSGAEPVGLSAVSLNDEVVPEWLDVDGQMIVDEAENQHGEIVALSVEFTLTRDTTQDIETHMNGDLVFSTLVLKFEPASRCTSSAVYGYTVGSQQVELAENWQMSVAATDNDKNQGGLHEETPILTIEDARENWNHNIVSNHVNSDGTHLEGENSYTLADLETIDVDDSETFRACSASDVEDCYDSTANFMCSGFYFEKLDAALFCDCMQVYIKCHQTHGCFRSGSKSEAFCLKALQQSPVQCPAAQCTTTDTSASPTVIIVMVVIFFGAVVVLALSALRH